MTSKMQHTASDEIELLIRYVTRLRQLLHVYSLVYYHYGVSPVDDATWDDWSKKLTLFQSQVPWLRYEGYLAEWFYDWTGDTGMHLPNRGWAHDEALRVIDPEGLM